MAATPEALVIPAGRQYGRFTARPQRLNPLDQWTGPRRRLKRLRLKEWIYFTLIHPELFSAMAIQDAGYLSSSEIYACARADGRLHQHARNGLGGTLQMPERLIPSRCRFAASGYELFTEFGGEGGEHRIEIDIAPGRHGAALRASLILHAAAASAPLMISSPIPGGVICTHKRAFPVSGTFAVGEQTVTLDPARDLAILDEHKSFLPYRTAWTWGTFATIANGAVLGANLIEREESEDGTQEGAAWIDGAVEPVDDITFRRTGEQWQARSRDGRLAVTFTPHGVKRVNHQLLLAAIDYRQIFGTYSGSVCGRQIADAPGVIETMRARL